MLNKSELMTIIKEAIDEADMAYRARDLEVIETYSTSALTKIARVVLELVKSIDDERSAT